MKLFHSFNFFFVLLGCVVVLVRAEQQMPPCAATCLASSLKAQSVCSATNVTCICTNAPLTAAIQGCVLQSCTIKNALVAQNVTATMCQQPTRDITHVTPVVVGVSGGLALVAVIVRCISTNGYFGWDDAFAVAALISALPMGILEFFMAHYGFGRDIWYIPAHRIYDIVKLTWLTEVFYFMATGFIKMCFLFFYLRIFPRREMKTTCYILIGICVAYEIAFVVTTIFNCTPLSFIWTSWDGEHHGKCINFHIFAWVHAGINIVFDAVIICVPLPELLKLSLSSKKKIYLLMMFSIGTFTTIVSMIRLKSLVQFSASSNPTYDNVPTAYWSCLEAFVGIFCACMPALRRFLGAVFPRCFGSTEKNSYPTPNYRISGRKTPGASIGSGGWRRAQGRGKGSGITKTMETTVEMGGGGEDDEVQLVELGRASPGKAWSGEREESVKTKVSDPDQTFYRS